MWKLICSFLVRMLVDPSQTSRLTGSRTSSLLSSYLGQMAGEQSKACGNCGILWPSVTFMYPQVTTAKHKPTQRNTAQHSESRHGIFDIGRAAIAKTRKARAE